MFRGNGSHLARPGVDVAGTEPMGARERQRQAFAVLRRQDQVNVVGHLAIGPDLDAEATAGPSEPIAIERIVAVLEKDALAPVAPLGHMMRQARDDDAGDAGHAATPNTGS